MTIRLSRWWAGLVLTGIATLAIGTEKAAAQEAGAKNASHPDLNGVWQGFVVEGKGEQPDRGPTHLELTVKGNHISAKRLDGEGGSLGEGNYKFTRGRLLLMDATEVRNRRKGSTYQGICAVEPDVLKWCVATPGNKRPKDFETKGQQFLLILKRQQ